MACRLCTIPVAKPLTALEKQATITMPKRILQVNQAMFETKLDRMVSEKVNEILNRMLDASGRPDRRRR